MSFFGRRGLLKVNSLWLPLAVLLLSETGADAGGCLLRLSGLFAAVVSWAFVSTLSNDRVEKDDDSAAGKSRWVGALPTAKAVFIILAFFAAGWGSLLVFRVRTQAQWVYLAAILLGLAYSVRPFRLKERGAWGLFGYSLSCACAYVLLPWAALGGSLEALLLLGLAVFLDKWVNLHFHQIVDHDADRTGRVRTHAVQAGLERARRSLRWSARASAAASAAAILYAAALSPGPQALILALSVGALLAAASLARASRKLPSLRTALVRELPWAYLGLSLAAFRAAPLVLFWGLASARCSLRPAFSVVSVLIVSDMWLLFRYRYE